jgi:hypothetical protein
MTKEQVTSLLDKYWEAETSVEEEKMLKAYFMTEGVDPSVRQYRSMFAHFDKEGSLEFTKELEIPSISIKTKEAKIIKLPFYKNIVAIAAILVLAIASVLVVRYAIPANDVKTIDKNSTMAATYIEIEDPEEALQYTEDALKLMAHIFNTGQEKLDQSMKTIAELPVLGQN